MMIETNSARLPLHAGQVARLQVRPLTRVRGLTGHAWLTLDDDRRDIVLGPGDEFVATASGRALVTALRADAPAELLVSA